MKNYIIVMVILFTVAFLASCSNETSPLNKQVILRGKSIKTGIVTPILTTFRYNVYKIGDTVWVNKQTAKIQNIGPISINQCCELYIVEEDNDSLELQHYTNKQVKQ